MSIGSGETESLDVCSCYHVYSRSHGDGVTSSSYAEVPSLSGMPAESRTAPPKSSGTHFLYALTTDHKAT